MGSAFVAFGQPDAPAAQQAVIGKYCITCHSAKLRTGGLSLQDADLNNVPAVAETWEKVIRKLRTGSMPPQGLPRLPGKHDLCLRFARPRLDPLWALDWIEIGK